MTGWRERDRGRHDRPLDVDHVDGALVQAVPRRSGHAQGQAVDVLARDGGVQRQLPVDHDRVGTGDHRRPGGVGGDERHHAGDGLQAGEPVGGGVVERHVADALELVDEGDAGAVAAGGGARLIGAEGPELPVLTLPHRSRGRVDLQQHGPLCRTVRHPRHQGGAVAGHRDRHRAPPARPGGEGDATPLGPGGHVDDRDVLAGGVGDVERPAVGAEVEAAGLGAPDSDGRPEGAGRDRQQTSMRFDMGSTRRQWCRKRRRRTRRRRGPESGQRRPGGGHRHGSSHRSRGPDDDEDGGDDEEAGEEARGAAEVPSRCSAPLTLGRATICPGSSSSAARGGRRPSNAPAGGVSAARRGSRATRRGASSDVAGPQCGPQVEEPARPEPPSSTSKDVVAGRPPSRATNPWGRSAAAMVRNHLCCRRS